MSKKAANSITLGYLAALPSALTLLYILIIDSRSKLKSSVCYSYQAYTNGIKEAHLGILSALEAAIFNHNNY